MREEDRVACDEMILNIDCSECKVGEKGGMFAESKTREIHNPVACLATMR
jgi:hypothetical protein